MTVISTSTVHPTRHRQVEQRVEMLAVDQQVFGAKTDRIGLKACPYQE